jgi:hypothetical protein
VVGSTSMRHGASAARPPAACGSGCRNWGRCEMNIGVSVQEMHLAFASSRSLPMPGRRSQGMQARRPVGAWKPCAALSAEHVDKWCGSAFTNPSASCWVAARPRQRRRAADPVQARDGQPSAQVGGTSVRQEIAAQLAGGVPRAASCRLSCALSGKRVSRSHAHLVFAAHDHLGREYAPRSTRRRPS